MVMARLLVAMVAVAAGAQPAAAQAAAVTPVAVGAQRLLPLFQRMYAGWNSILGHRGYLEDLARLLSMPAPSGLSMEGDPSVLPFHKAVTLRGVGFRYRPDTPWVFRGLDLRIEKGARVGFAGESGCGKSTLLDLLMGLLQPLEGRLEVDGEPLTPAVVHHWQARIAHVPQSVFLADTTIARNVAFGRPTASIDMARVEEAARKANLHDFILTLPDGYETGVGERGVQLSGGQRQRVGIARALYREADVLVLDEATSALDGETERAVMAGLEAIGREVTLLIVAHRRSTLEACDYVVELAGARGGKSGGTAGP
jgi:ABC-type bacteriocin/lantibiotic exporter with double-glycine peptidase domain